VRAVPGITAAAGICAELGIPMTHRGVATSVRYLTGHARERGEALLDEAISGCADPHTTLVVYMGLQTLPQLSRRLQEGGLAAGTPVVAVERGTTADARVVFGSLQELHVLAREARLQSPTLVVIGEVVALCEGWAEWRGSGRPLVRQAGAAAAQPWGGAAAGAQQQALGLLRRELPSAPGKLL
jgi:siroheme synthase